MHVFVKCSKTLYKADLPPPLWLAAWPSHAGLEYLVETETQEVSPGPCPALSLHCILTTYLLLSECEYELLGGRNQWHLVAVPSSPC